MAIKLNLYCENAYDYCCGASRDMLLAYMTHKGTFYEYFMTGEMLRQGCFVGFDVTKFSKSTGNQNFLEVANACNI